MKLFGYKFAGSHEVHTMGEEKLTRFQEKKTRRAVAPAPARPVGEVPALKALALSTPERPILPPANQTQAVARNLRDAMTTVKETPAPQAKAQPKPQPAAKAPQPVAEASGTGTFFEDLAGDDLHSEAGLSPSILRRALPQRFQKMDTDPKPALGQDFLKQQAALA